MKCPHCGKAIESEDNSAPRQQAKDLLEFLNIKTGRHYRSTETNLKMILARMKQGYTHEEIAKVIIYMVKKWGNNPEMRDYLRPATLFNDTKFNQYAGEAL